ncbi:diguanylate cyclase domain-containing protein [Rheinheimera sp.]|uniref:diguanylate cyclase domain-containing protein n=1 Tax=Rheinheimera sp. TaxID=1869214 RepID=UPI0027B9FAB8|nr:diguanylate cyclase [Rheinheimera sp.]
MPFNAKHKNHQLAWIIAISITFFLVIFAFRAYVQAEKQVEQSAKARLDAFEIADEFRHSSETLTKMVRNYITTGDDKYRQLYLDLMAIRDGEKARPESPYIYWDLVIYGGVAPSAVGSQKENALQRAKIFAFGRKENELLTLAFEHSRQLSDIELNAIRIFGQATTEAQKQQARQMVFDANYDRFKLAILEPIDAFTTLIEQRTADSLKRSLDAANVARWVFASSGLLWLALLWFSYRSLQKVLGAAPYTLRQQLAALGQGDFTSNSTSNPSFSSDSVMAWLQQTRLQLQNLSAQRDVAEKKLAYRNHFLNIYNRVLADLNSGLSMKELLDEVMKIIESHHAGILCSVLLVSEDGKTLQHASSPSIALSWREVTKEVSVAEGVGSCGTAAARKSRVIVEDISSHPFWRDFKDDALAAGLRACWSQPFMDSRGHFLGTFAIYHQHSAVPDDDELRLIEEYSQLTAFIVEKARMAEQLREVQQRYQLVVENSNDVIWVAELPSLKFIYRSPSVKRLRGYTAEELTDLNISQFASQDNNKVNAELERLYASIAKGDYSKLDLKLEMELQHKDGHMVPVEVVARVLLGSDGQPKQLVGVTRDISERKAAEDTIKRMAYYDPLTALPNRRLLEERMNQLLLVADRKPQQLALLFIDLDKFKQVNDIQGHDAGDWLLRQVAERMLCCLRQSDTPARVGGDEFIVLLPDINTQDDALQVAEKIRAQMEQTFVMDDGVELHISSSIGVVLYPEHAGNSRDLMKFGDEAMYHAKRNGRNAVYLFHKT